MLDLDIGPRRVCVEIRLDKVELSDRTHCHLSAYILDEETGTKIDPQKWDMMIGNTKSYEITFTPAHSREIGRDGC